MDAVVIVVDIGAFTTIAMVPRSAPMPLLDVEQLIRSIIHKCGGRLAATAGDSIFAVFPANADSFATDAIDTACEIEAGIGELQQRAATSGMDSSVTTYIGVATGEVYEGPLGPPDAPIAAFFGPALTIAKLLARECRSRRVRVLVCKRTADAATNRYDARAPISLTTESGAVVHACEPVLRSG